MLNYILKPVVHQSFYKKYASKKYLKVCLSLVFPWYLSSCCHRQASTFVREWALERWEEGTRVNLMDELPEIKAMIRAANEREQARLEAEGGVAGEAYEEEA
jgi:G2/mitotic-specific cyclin 2